jgi:hypothetical protein
MYPWATPDNHKDRPARLEAVEPTLRIEALAQRIAAEGVDVGHLLGRQYRESNRDGTICRSRDHR